MAKDIDSVRGTIYDLKDDINIVPQLQDETEMTCEQVRMKTPRDACRCQLVMTFDYCNCHFLGFFIAVFFFWDLNPIETCVKVITNGNYT